MASARSLNRVTASVSVRAARSASVKYGASRQAATEKGAHQVAPLGRLFLVLEVTISGGRITAIDAVADPGRLRQLELAILD